MMRALLAGFLLALICTSSAYAALSISDKATENVTCEGGACSATAKKAVLNVTDLTDMLAAGSVTVESGDQAQDIAVDAAFRWASSNALTLEAKQSLAVNKAVADAGPAALTLAYGKKGDLRFGPEGNISFTSTSTSLTINKKLYTLVDSIALLASAVAKKPSGRYALAHGYDAGNDGMYSDSPITTPFTGTLEGLGNTISNLEVLAQNPEFEQRIGFIAIIGTGGAVFDLGIVSSSVGEKKVREAALVGVLAGENDGLIERSFSNGTIKMGRFGDAGGLIGVNHGVIRDAHASVDLSSTSAAVGGLVSINDGKIAKSFANGSGGAGGGGGLVAGNFGSIVDCYSTGSIKAGASGGLVGGNSSVIDSSFSVGLVVGKGKGGLIGRDNSSQGSLSNTYWDLDTSGVSDPSLGAGNVLNDPGIKGLTDVQLKAGLPAGFDPSIWTQNSNVNDGYPYLINNPPSK